MRRNAGPPYPQAVSESAASGRRMVAVQEMSKARLRAHTRKQVILGEVRKAAREMAASGEAAAASIRAAAREAPRSAAWEYVPFEVPSTLAA